MSTDVNAARRTLCIPRESVCFANGAKVGKYMISSFLAEGSQATLFEIIDSSNHKHIMRVYFDGEAPHEDISKAFFRTSDDHLCKIVDRGVFDNHVYDVVEKLNNISDIRQLSNERQLLLLKQEAEAVRAIHDKGICHLDIKKEHFMQNDTGVVKLVDIGSSKKIGDEPPLIPGPFLPSDSYTNLVCPENDYFSFGIAIIEQFVPDWLNGKTREEIVLTVSSSEKLAKAIERLPPHLQAEVRLLVSDNPGARKECSWFSERHQNVHDNSGSCRIVPQEQRSPHINLQQITDAVKIELLRIVSRSSPSIFVAKIQPAARAVSFRNVDSLLAFLQLLKSIPREATPINYTNLNKNNILEALSGEVIITPQKLSTINPIRSMKKYAHKNTFYIFDQKTILELDKQGAIITNERNKKAWAALKIIGIVIGVAAAIAVVIAVVIAILYVLFCLAVAALVIILICAFLD